MHTKIVPIQVGNYLSGCCPGTKFLPWLALQRVGDDRLLRSSLDRTAMSQPPNIDQLRQEVAELRAENMRLRRLMEHLTERWAGVPVSADERKRDLQYIASVFK